MDGIDNAAKIFGRVFRRLFVSTLIFWLAVTAGPASELVEPRGLKLIHQGRLSAGIQVLHEQAAAHPDDGSAQFWGGVASWWRHVSEFGNEDAAWEAVEYFDRALEVGWGKTPGPAERLEEGTAWMLRSHLEGAHGSVLRAALNARKGKRILEEVRAEDPGLADVGFALGAYDYYADRLPTIVKGIRALLFLPGGDASKGIAELEHTAKRGRLFMSEAALVLADIQASSEEEKYHLGLELVDGLVKRHPENPFFRMARSELLSDIGEFERAVADIEAALASLDPADADLAVGLKFQEARLRDKGFETAKALTIAQELMGQDLSAYPRTQRQRVAYLLGELKERLGDEKGALAAYNALGKQELDRRLERRVERKLSGGIHSALPSYVAAQAAVSALREDRAAESERLLGELMADQPEDPILTFFLAEAVARQGRMGEAKRLYETARVRSGAEQGWVRGWCLVRLGELEAVDGDRDAALERYRQAALVEDWGGAGVVAYRVALVASLPVPRAPAVH